MSFCISKKIQVQGISDESLRMDEETMLVQKQGIVTILGSDFDSNRASATSLRRTLSADMSSKKWLLQNGVSPMKKISSSEELSHSHSHSKVTAESLSSSEGEEDDYEEMKELEVEVERERFKIWSSIQRDKKEEQHEKPGPFDIWSSILSQKANDETSNKLPPYIHPLVKSKSCLSKKSLEICTESLGSETGSDGFSSCTPSETGDSEEDKDNMEEEEEVTVQAHEEELQVPKYNYAEKKSLSRSFPPPLPSLRMQSHRDNGRLFLQAVSIPSQNNFCAQRQDGRLVLTLASHPDKDDSQVTEEDDDDDDDDDDEEKDHVDEEEEEEEEFVKFEEDYEAEEDDADIKQAPILCSGLSSVHRLALMMNKQIELVNRSPKWSEKLNEVANFEDVNVEQHSPVAQSLPLRTRARLIPSTPTVAAFNAYEYYWQTKPTANAASIPNTFTHQHYNYSSLKNNHSHSKLVVSGDINQTSNDDRQQLLVLRGKNGDYLVHSLKSCKDSRRSFLFWEPYCIAT
ncbi:protein FAF-like, chloroplastic [Gastrolobium bilobum]|uniref:protein FAF-like, chloroplastic n=1 Tax=Gastrolobium bilobum TaxID=150636 RepID=UPI002AB0A4BB|nr:protein FAF-like, chloroplastic [Gastrolobium bilobum]